MKQNSLFTSTASLFDELCEIRVLKMGFKAVKCNKGSEGVDKVSISCFESDLDKELGQLKKELEDWAYKPRPVRRVEIPKPCGNGVRLLGVPCIRDRVVQASIKILLEPLLDDGFSDNSYGFRPERSQEQAVKAAHEIVKSGKSMVVDIDLSKFFDRVNHDRLLSKLSGAIEDKRIIRLIGKTLRSGVMVEGVYEPTSIGTTQGSPLSPLLSNFVLDELDKELENRGLSFCRFADDCNIFVKTQKAGDRVLKSISKFIENKLKLKVNWDKSKVAPSREVKFLGMTIVNNTVSISKISLQRAMKRVKELTPRGTNRPMEKTLEEINLWYIGWANYYKMTNYPSQLRKIECHVRRRLRSRIVGHAKRKRFLARKLIARGVKVQTVNKVVYSNNKRWKLSHTFALAHAYPQSWFEQMGHKTFSDRSFDHWFSIQRWVKLT